MFSQKCFECGSDEASTATPSYCCSPRGKWKGELRNCLGGTGKGRPGTSRMDSEGKGGKGGKGKTGQIRGHKVVVLVNADAKSCENFSIRGALLGQGGENFQHICKEAGVHLSLLGCGTGRDEDRGPMRIVITTDQHDKLAKAKELTEDLVSSVNDKQRERTQRLQNQPKASDGKGVKGSWDARKGQGKAAYINHEKERLKKEAENRKQQAEEMRKEIENKKALVAEKKRMLRESANNALQMYESHVKKGDVREAQKIASASGFSIESAKAFWKVLEESRAAEQSPEAIKAREAVVAARQEVSAAEKSVTATAQDVMRAQGEARQLQAASQSLTVATLKGAASRCCALFAAGNCPFAETTSCPRGSHEKPEASLPADVFAKITKAKLRLLEQKWIDAGGRGTLVNGWQVRNPQLEFLFRGAEANFQELYGELSDVIDGWHGSREENIVSIAINGFDPKRRSGQVYGAGEYFAKDPNVSISYAGGGSFMFLCKILLGKENVDHTWASGPRYYVIKQREGRVQVIPMFVLQFKESRGAFHRQLTTELAVTRDAEDSGTLATQQRGGMYACKGRRDAGITADATQHLWLGWLSPSLRFQDDDCVAEDVCEFLRGVSVKQVIPERDGSRIGAFVLLESAITQVTFKQLSQRPYHGEHRISVDDAQPGNPRCAGKLCPRLSGPSQFCRGWNMGGHAGWHWACSFDHPEDQRPTFDADVELEAIRRGSAKFDEIETEMRRSISGAHIVSIVRARNSALEKLYEQRRAFIHEKQGFVVEKELWHGTSVDAIPTLLQHGLQPPADRRPSNKCPTSGNKGLCTTLCSTDCKLCTEAHCWNKCHMYGLGVYLADIAQKSHQYVRKSASERTYSMLRCRVILGNPYLIEGNLLSGSAMHDLCWCKDPSDFLDKLAEDWSISKGHDSYYVQGQAGSQKHGLGVHNNEYIVFQPYQILPLYRVDYTC